MKAAVYRRYGPPSVVQIEDVPTPKIREDQVLVRVHATTVSAGDRRLRAADLPGGFGWIFRLAFGFSGPRRRVLGVDFSGTVEDVGATATRFKRGDRVFGASSKMGCHAEFVAIDAEGAIASLPPTIGFPQAAAIPFGGATALNFLKKAAVRRGDRVLINGAAGAVGTACVQLAKRAGAHVTAVCSAANERLVKDLGADAVVDYRTTDLATVEGPFDVIVDVVGNAPYARVKALLAPQGRLCLVTATLGQMLGAGIRPKRAGRRVISLVAPERRDDLEELRDATVAGAFRPVIEKAVPLARIVEAHELADSGHKKGNVVVLVASSAAS